MRFTHQGMGFIVGVVGFIGSVIFRVIMNHFDEDRYQKEFKWIFYGSLLTVINYGYQLCA